MYPTCGEQQQKEIESIGKRILEIKLSDEDVKRVSMLVGAHGLTISELIENFIGDLVCGTYSNGSDEREFAKRWFDRCWFGSYPDRTFLSYLVDWGEVDYFLESWDQIVESEENIQNSKEALESGVMTSCWSGEAYTWKDLVNGDNKPCYSNRKEWEAEEQEYIEQEQEIVEDSRKAVSDCWDEYIKLKREYKNGSFEEELKKVLDWRQEYQNFLNSGKENTQSVTDKSEA